MDSVAGFSHLDLVASLSPQPSLASASITHVVKHVWCGTVIRAMAIRCMALKDVWRNLNSPVFVPKRPTAPWHHGTTWYHSTTVPWHHSTTVRPLLACMYSDDGDDGDGLMMLMMMVAGDDDGSDVGGDVDDDDDDDVYRIHESTGCTK